MYVYVSERERERYENTNGGCLSSGVDAARLHQLVLKASSDRDTGVPTAKSDICRTTKADMIVPNDPRNHMPSVMYVDLDFDQDGPLFLILTQRVRNVRRNWHGRAVDERRPDMDAIFVLEYGRQSDGNGDRLVNPVRHVHIYAVVVDADLVGIPRRDCDLEIGGEEAPTGDVKLVHRSLS
uniref:Uncharacterized protein n=1 Tax=Nelumbo nucifera TaxID=4432 RepID=A0A822ZTW0_NELNU|nr:TPA_asm: hypothetical protein HUJ06_018330 [Nelumbo nucifera]